MKVVDSWVNAEILMSAFYKRMHVFLLMGKKRFLKFSILADKIGLFFIMQAMVHVLLSTLRKIALIPLDHMYVRVYLAMALMWRPLSVTWVSIMSK